MRFAYLVPIVSLCLSSGCSTLIAVSGKDLSKLTTREQIHASLGEPVATGIENGKPFEEYHTRRKISEADTMRASSLSMGFAMSYGVCELITFPKELYLLGSRTLCGQTVRVTYDGNGKVSGFTLEGESLNVSSWLSKANGLQDTATLPTNPAASALTPSPSE